MKEQSTPEGFEELGRQLAERDAVIAQITEQLQDQIDSVAAVQHLNRELMAKSEGYLKSQLQLQRLVEKLSKSTGV